MAQCGGNPSRYAATKPTERDLKVVAKRAGNNWSSLLISLDIPWATIESIKAENSTNLWEACMKGLVIWLKGGVSDSNEPVTFGTLFAALKDSEMADCISLLVDRLDERSTPHPRPTHEDEDEDLSTPTSERGKQLTVMNELLQEVRVSKEQQCRMVEELALLRREQDKARKDNLEQGSLVGGEKEKDTQIAKLLEEVQRLKLSSPASSSSPAKPFKPVQTKPPRNWRGELKCQNTLEYGGECYSIAVQGDIVCVGVKGRVLLFSKTSGAQVRELGSDQIKGLGLGVAFIDEDTIVVSADKRLRTYTTNGQLVRTFDSGKAEFDPRGLTVGPDGRIFVCDEGNHCVCIFTVDGKLLSSFGSKGSGIGHFNRPWDVCMGGGLLFISDMGNSKICVHGVEGAFITEFPTARQPYCVAATHCNRLVVSSGWSHTVMIMTTSGQLVHEFGGEGRGPGQFSYPAGVAVDNEDCVYVCDRGNKRVQVY